MTVHKVKGPYQIIQHLHQVLLDSAAHAAIVQHHDLVTAVGQGLLRRHKFTVDVNLAKLQACREQWFVQAKTDKKSYM